MGSKETAARLETGNASQEEAAKLSPVPVEVKALLPAKLPKEVDATVPATMRWNTHNLGWRLGADFLAAASAGVLVAPIITMIDK